MDFSAASIFLARLPDWAQTLIGLAVLVLVATLANLIVKQVIVRLIDHGLESFGLDTEEDHLDPVVRRLANIFPALVISGGIVLVPDVPAKVVDITRNLVAAFIVLTVVMAISAALNYVNALYQRRPEAASRPIKGYIQVAKILLYGASAILIVAALMEQSPLLLLSGLGAMAAVLMLVFKDTILSLVASVQLSSNDMLRVGDWIEMPQLNANGDVIDIALHTVKVQNFDKTITTVPTYRLISDSFVNWRGMTEAGGRRIMRSLYIDQNSVRFLTADEKTALARFDRLKPYIESKRMEIERWNADIEQKGQDPVNHRELTNLGTFRAYTQAFVESHPRISKGMTLMVRQLAPEPEGLPIEIYCFTNTIDWSDYEAIQADIFDHLLAIMPHFGLRLFQQPGGMDLRQLPDLLGKDSERLRPCPTQ